MQIYVVGVQTLAIQPALPPPAIAPKRHIYCDLAVRSASCQALPDRHGWQRRMRVVFHHCAHASTRDPTGL